jgi:hypothetical protein
MALRQISQVVVNVRGLKFPMLIALGPVKTLADTGGFGVRGLVGGVEELVGGATYVRGNKA